MVNDADRKRVPAADLKPGMVARTDSDSYGVVKAVPSFVDELSAWKVQLVFFVDPDHEFDTFSFNNDLEGDR